MFGEEKRTGWESEVVCPPVRTSPIMAAMSSKKEGYFKTCTNCACISVMIMIGMLPPIAYIDLRGGQGQPSGLGGGHVRVPGNKGFLSQTGPLAAVVLGSHVDVKHSTKLFFSFSPSFFLSGPDDGEELVLGC